MRIFISSVQKEFAAERAALGEFVAGDALLSKLFETFIFERDIPAVDRRPDEVYLDEVARCDLYLGLFGDEYGWENNDGLSPTHLEFNEATRLGKPRFIYVKGSDDDGKDAKMRALVHEVGNQVIRRRFHSIPELRTAVYASLVNHLEATGVIHNGPWDATAARKARLDDLDPEAITRFVRRARKARNFPVAEEAEMEEVLTHLNLLDDGRPTHAAVLLFGRYPQRHHLPSEVKCAHFHGTEVAKPIPSYQVYKGTAFDLVDQAVDFVLSKINVSVGTREQSTRAPVAYEIPREVVREAIVNAVAHRDYTSTASVQVMLFADRLEVWNPGTLPPSLTLDKLRVLHGSFPANPLLAEPLYLTKYIERLGTGTRDMIRRCREAGLPEPEFRLTDGFVVTIRRPARSKSDPDATQSRPSPDSVTDPVTDPVDRVVLALASGEMAPSGLQKRLGLKHRPTFRENYLRPAIERGLAEATLPDKPTSRLQKYRLTEKGRAVLEELRTKKEKSGS
jgi:predicted HTH transcriptional regulator